MKRTSGNSAFNWNRPITRDGPFKGLVVYGDTIAVGLEHLNFPSEPPVAYLSVDDSTREFGSSTSVVLHYTVVVKSNPIATIKLDGVTRSNVVFTDTVTTSCIQDQATTYTLDVTTASEHVDAKATVSWRNKKFAFLDTSNLLSATDAQLSALLQAKPGGWADNRNFNDYYTPYNQYIYFAYAASFGVAAGFMVGGLPNTAYQLHQFTYTNQYGHQELYNLYRSGGIGTGSINVVLQ